MFQETITIKTKISKNKKMILSPLCSHLFFNLNQNQGEDNNNNNQNEEDQTGEVNVTEHTSSSSSSGSRKKKEERRKEKEEQEQQERIEELKEQLKKLQEQLKEKLEDEAVKADEGKGDDEFEEEEIEKINLNSKCLNLKSKESILSKWNDDSQSTKKIQTYLKKQRYYLGKVDGIFGKKTYNALKEFQKDNDLTQDGKFGKQTLSYIDLHCKDETVKDKESVEEEIEKEIEEEKIIENNVKNNIGIGVYSTEVLNKYFKEIFKNQNVSDKTQKEVINELIEKNIVSETKDENGNTIIEVKDKVKLKELEESYNIKLLNKYNIKKDKNGEYVKDENGDYIKEELEIEFPEETLKGKILDVEHIPQSVKYEGKSYPSKLGTSMCSASSVNMIANYYNKLENTNSDIKEIYGHNVDLNLQKYNYFDIENKLSKSCLQKVDGKEIDGAFATTSGGECVQAQGFTEYKEFFDIYGLKMDYLSKKFTDFRKVLDKNRPIIFGEAGHIMVAVGYLDIPESEKTNIKVNLENSANLIEKQITVKKEFLLIVNDPKRNRNQSRKILEDNKVTDHYFESNGAKSAYLIVSYYNENGLYTELMCRSGLGSKGLDSKYTCIPVGGTRYEISN